MNDYIGTFMVIVLILIPLLALAYLYRHFKSIFTGKQGRLLALFALVMLLVPFLFQSSYPLGLIRTFFIVGISNYLMACIFLDDLSLGYRIIYHQWLERWRYRKYALSSLIIAGMVTSVMVVYGMYHNNHYTIRHETITLKHGSRAFRIVYFSDIHLDPLFPRSKLEKMVHDIDSLQADAIFFGGDLADMGQKDLNRRGFDTLFQKIKAPLGFWGITGNHEGYNTARQGEPISWMRNNGMTWLLDSTVCTRLFCLTGRLDPSMASQWGTLRLPLNILEKDILHTEDRPWFVLDHQPRPLSPEERPNRIPDLVMSGHTHAGQFFPWTWIIGLVWDLSEGFGNLEGIPWFVSSGFGSWGAPVRIGSKTELVIFDFLPAKTEKSLI